MVERCGISADQLETLNLLHEPIPPTRDVTACAVIIGGAGTHSAVDDHPFTEPLTVLINELVERGTPLWGTCWGHQMMARALGGELLHDPDRGEVGTHEVTLLDAGQSDPLFDGVPLTFLTQMGHHDHVTALPAGAIEMARTPLSANQVFRLPDRPVYGTQFHTELDARRLTERLTIYKGIYTPGEGHLERTIDAIEPTPHADTLMKRFFDLFVWTT